MCATRSKLVLAFDLAKRVQDCIGVRRCAHRATHDFIQVKATRLVQQAQR